MSLKSDGKLPVQVAKTGVVADVCCPNEVLNAGPTVLLVLPLLLMDGQSGVSY